MCRVRFQKHSLYIMTVKQQYICKKLQFIHTVNGDRSEKCKNHKKALLTTLTLTFRFQAMLVWLIVPFYDFCGFWSVAVNSRLCINCSFFYIYKCMVYIRSEHFSYSFIVVIRYLRANQRKFARPPNFNCLGVSSYRQLFIHCVPKSRPPNSWR